ncbi:hypothetical protein ACSFBF_28730 [Variovorax sp. ZT5P49]|uniref:hypothetical protein n=1 Tax=Variovorax sp. ZT5P49 TaxID=3443733 RepID=UPI003F458773
MDTQHLHAGRLLKLIRDRVEAKEPPILGYAVAANLLGLKGDSYARAMGQVCSRIDAASFVAGWPMLALRMVRKPDGSLNAASFEDAAWAPWEQEFRKLAQSHEWAPAQVDDVIRALDGLPEVGALGIWNGYLKRETQTPGFIRYNLHRKLGLA